MIQELTRLLFIFLKSRGKDKGEAQCAVTRVQVEWLGKHAFRHVLRSRPSGYETCIERLDMALANDLGGKDEKILRKVTQPRSLDCFADYVY